MTNHHALRVRSRPGGVLQKSDVLAVRSPYRSGEFDRLLARLIDVDPLHAGFAKSLGHIRPGAIQMRIRHRKARGAITHNACARIKRAVAPREHQRNWNYTRQQTPEVTNDKVKPGPKQKEGTITSLTAFGQPCRHHTSSLKELPERQNRFFLSLVRHEHVGAIVRLLSRAMTKQIDKRHKRWPVRVEHSNVPQGCHDHLSVEHDAYWRAPSCRCRSAPHTVRRCDAQVL